MKHIKIIVIALLTVSTTISCFKSKLNQPVYGQYDAAALANKKGVGQLLIGAYSILEGFSINSPYFFFASGASNWITGSICGGEAYKGADPGNWNEIADLETFIPQSNNYFGSKVDDQL
jgi:hypothetical protein